MTDHRARVEELLAEYRRSKEHLATVHQDLSAIRETASSADGSVTATVGSRGTLTGLTLRDDAYRRFTPAELADEIRRVVGAATAAALTRTSEALAPALPHGSDPQALLFGTADLAPADLAVADPTPGGPVERETAEASVSTVRPASAERKPTPPEIADEDEDFERKNWVAEGWRDR